MFDPNFTPKKQNPNLKVVSRPNASEKQPNFGVYLFIFILIIGGVFAAYNLISGSKKSPVITDEHGNRMLAPHRKAKLDKELKEIDNAIQYVLIARKNGYFPCFTCPDGAGRIYLYKGEVWKYGSTRKGEKGRYPNKNYGAENVQFIIEFTGTLSECIKMEKTKIYNYPLLPEAEKRDFLLVIPPGNSYDN